MTVSSGDRFFLNFLLKALILLKPHNFLIILYFSVKLAVIIRLRLHEYLNKALSVNIFRNPVPLILFEVRQLHQNISIHQYLPNVHWIELTALPIIPRNVILISLLFVLLGQNPQIKNRRLIRTLRRALFLNFSNIKVLLFNHIKYLLSMKQLIITCFNSDGLTALLNPDFLEVFYDFVFQIDQFVLSVLVLLKFPHYFLQFLLNLIRLFSHL